MSEKKTLIAIKPMTYATRRLLPGDSFQASDRDARILVFAKRAKAGGDRPVGKLPAPHAKLIAKAAATVTPPSPPEHDEPAAPEDAPAPDTSALRAEYEAKFGKKPFMGWDADTLRQKIDAEA